MKTIELSAGSLLLAAYALLGTGLWLQNGHYTPTAFGLLAASFGCTLIAFARRDGREPARLSLLAALAYVLLLNACARPEIHLQKSWFAPAYQMFCGSLLPLAAIVHLPVLRSVPIARKILIAVAVIGALFFRVMTPIASPAPVIDVFAFSQQSAELVLEGKNPYVEELIDPWHGWAEFVVPEHFTYPPANLYLVTMSRMASGDVRYVSIAAELVIALSLYWISHSRWSREGASILPLLFLYHPRGLLVIELAWTEPLLLAAFALWMLLQVQGRRTAAAVIYGYFLSLKQYLLFFFLEWFIIERNVRLLLLGIAVAAATAVPFAWWNFASFWEQGILFNIVHTEFRRDSLSITSALYPLIGPTGKSLSVIVGAAAALWSFCVLRKEGLSGYSWAVTISTFAMFLFGSQAFCNYYYFVGGLMLFTLLQQSEPTAPTEGRSLIDSRQEIEQAS